MQDYYSITYEEQEGDDRVLPQLMPDDDLVPCKDQERDDQIPPQEMPEDGKIPSDEQESDDCGPPKSTSEDDEVLSEDQKRVDSIPPNFIIRHSEICLSEEFGDILLLNKRTYKVTISIGFMAYNMHPINSVFVTGEGHNVIQRTFSTHS